jgi:hypothetical protein
MSAVDLNRAVQRRSLARPPLGRRIIEPIAHMTDPRVDIWYVLRVPAVAAHVERWTS